MVINEKFRQQCSSRSGQMCMYEPRQRCKKRCAEGNCPEAPGEASNVKTKASTRGRRTGVQ